MSSRLFKFTTIVSQYDFGKLRYSVVYLHPNLYDKLPLKEHPRLRIEAWIGGVRVDGAWQPAGGIWRLMVSKQTLKKAGLEVGSPVIVAFRIVPQDSVNIPEELQSELEADDVAKKAWETLTPGKRRGLAYLVGEVKTPKSRAVRLARVLRMLHGEEPLPWDRMKEKHDPKDENGEEMP